MKKEKEKTIQEVLAAMKAEDILDEIRALLERSGETVETQAVWDIIRRGEDLEDRICQDLTVYLVPLCKCFSTSEESRI